MFSSYCYETILSGRVNSQDAAANEDVLSVYLTTILYYHLQLFIDIERENIPFVHSACFIVRSTRYD